MKLQVLVSDEMAQRIDKHAKEIGVTRSAFCAMLIGQGVSSYEQAQGIINSAGDEIVSQLRDKLVSQK
jgi:hypothetical protein